MTSWIACAAAPFFEPPRGDGLVVVFAPWTEESDALDAALEVGAYVTGRHARGVFTLYAGEEFAGAGALRSRGAVLVFDAAAMPICSSRPVST